MNVHRLLRNKNVLQTVIIYYSYLVFGFGSNLIATSLLDVTEIINSSVDDISTYSFVSSSVSYCCSSLIGGYFGKNVNRHLYLFFALALSGLARAAIPLCKNLSEYTVVMSLVGISNAGIDIGANSWLLSIWSHGLSNMYMQGMHFTWALGSAVSPLVAEPFLSRTTNVTVILFNVTTGTNETLIKEVASDSWIVYPFSLCAFLHLIGCCVLLFMYCVTKSDDPERSDRDEEEQLVESDQNDNLPTRLLNRPSNTFLILMAGAVIGLETGMEINTFNYLTVFAVGHKYSKSTGAYLLSALTICYTISRGLSTIAAFKTPIEYILICSLITISGAITLLTFLADAGDGYLWAGFCLIGFGFGPFYAGTFSYLSHHMEISTGICGIFIFLSSLTVILNDLTVGKLIVTHLYVYNLFNVISCILTVILFVILRLIMRRYDQNAITNTGRINSRTKVVKVSAD